MSEIDERAEKREERNGFLFLTIFMAPAIAVALVGGLGFLIWMYQLFAGPPGAPGS